MRVSLVARAVFGCAAIAVGSSHAAAQAPVQGAAPEHGASNPHAPLVLARQGSFFVNPHNVDAFSSGTGVPMPGSISTQGMYVQYQIPAANDPRMYPIIMVHGSAHTGKTYEETPDGRMGWAEYFVRHGAPVYVVDHAGRARSGFDPTPTNRARLESNPALVPAFAEFTNEQAWMNFRFGPAPLTAYENTRFPVAARDQYFAQIIPNTEASYADGGQSTIAALVALVDQIGPAVLLVHSQSGAYGLAVALARPDLVKAVVSVEPRGCLVPDEDVERVFTHVPFLSMFGDFFGTSVADWPGRMAECEATVARIQAVEGVAENIHLPARGIHGNSHMLMMDLNNLQLAEIIREWLAEHAPRR